MHLIGTADVGNCRLSLFSSGRNSAWLSRIELTAVPESNSIAKAHHKQVSPSNPGASFLARTYRLCASPIREYHVQSCICWHIGNSEQYIALTNEKRREGQKLNTEERATCNVFLTAHEKVVSVTCNSPELR
jgi:hypothetical protein